MQTVSDAMSQYACLCCFAAVPAFCLLQNNGYVRVGNKVYVNCGRR